MDNETKKTVEEYQCPGCINGSDISCYNHYGIGIECNRHTPGTYISPIGKVFLGLPKGFNRLGLCKTKINIFKKLSDGWGYDIFNIPVWKYKDKNVNVIVRGISPRINSPWIHIFLEDCTEKINCLEITDETLKEMD